MFEGRQLIPDRLAQLLDPNRLAYDRVSNHSLAPLIRGFADDRNVVNGGVLPKYVFHFTGIDVVAAANDEFFAAGSTF